MANRTVQSPAPEPDPFASPERRRLMDAPVALALGAALLVVASVASGMLVYKHFGGKVPGCGPRSACDELENSVWGKLPLVDWPVSFVGLAFFASMLVAWFAVRGRLPWSLRAMAGLGLAASVLLLIVMGVVGKFCPYCVGAHVGNLGFVAIALSRPREGTMKQRTSRARTIPLALGLWIGAFAISSGVLGVLEASHREQLRAKAETERRESAAKIVESSKGANGAQPADRWGAAGFTGRYRHGPEQAPIRIVVLTDYQCPDCKRVESEIDEMMRARRDISLSVKHFPMCTDCNKYAGRTLHPNACWAARAAEAAGILGGDEAFFKMHRWLFARGGRFETQDEISVGIREAGLDPAAFLPVMSGPETTKRVLADVEDGWALGVYFTPMVFINGVEMKGWQTPGNIKRTIEELAATNPPARTAAADRPALAAEKFVADWRDMPVITMPADERAWTLGGEAGSAPAGAAPPAAEVVVFGDYSEDGTAKVDLEIRAAMREHPGVRYTFRHYPVNKACNPVLPENVPAAAIHPLACRAALAAEAAGEVGGSEAYWKMHEWLMRNQRPLPDDALLAAAGELGLDGAAVLAAMRAPELSAAIEEDCRAAQRLGVTVVPTVYVNRRHVPRPLRPGNDSPSVMARIVEEAAEGG